MRLRFIFSELAISLRRNSLMMFAVVIITAFSMMALGIGLLSMSQVSTTKAAFAGKLQVSVFLCPSDSPDAQCPAKATESQINDIQNTLEGLRPLVTSVDFVDQDQAWQIFKDEFASQPDLVQSVDPSVLPESFVVKLSDPKKFDVIKTRVSSMPGVDNVQDANAFVNKLLDDMNQLRDFALLSCVIMIIAAGVLIGVAVQVAAVSRRRETGIMRLVGASSLYIQLPFLLEGALAGLIGAVCGFGGLLLFKWAVLDHILKQMQALLGGQLVSWSDAYGTVPWLIIVAVVVAGLASFVTLRRYLRV